MDRVDGFTVSLELTHSHQVLGDDSGSPEGVKTNLIHAQSKFGRDRS